MEVLEIEAVVPGLVVGVARESLLSALELDRKDRGARDQHRVDAAPEPGDVELEIDRALEVTQGVTQDLDLFLPRPALLGCELRVHVRHGEVTDHRLDRCVEELPDGRPVVRGGNPFNRILRHGSDHSCRYGEPSR